ncbi:hypothetical protein, variant 1 [Aphanomyces astaci]|uniref:Rap-GAP domain-containing protein n=1 Tax=Aphanomyces astaci TaxID=112090 RepID=W4GVM8_APHAT|nr:hypothetical protein, variant 1 [Aphanomyces astaci]ETV83727.1 hypothetical protein, variant 1 [Aphanomyces astaci]|eukprot:XP_009827158.1 hypothetical protein, variant 1 [Aphanomyces astaci]
MFLTWVSKCELLQAPPEAHILKGFNEGCQRGICSMVVGFLSNTSEQQSSTEVAASPLPPSMSVVLATPAHVRWAMEPLGHSFALGMEDSGVILGAIGVYEKWLGLGSASADGRPKCMHAQEQEFIRDLLGHMSLLFEDKEGHRSKPDLIATHATLCQTVLDLYSALGRKRGTQLTAATWDHLLRLLLGITDCVLHGSKHTLALSLCAHLFRVTLEQFILSLHVTGVKGELWNMLLKFCRRWLHRKAVIEQWHKASLALTQHLMGRLHAPPPSSSEHAAPPPSVSIKWMDNAHVTCFELASPLLAYAWYRVMRVIGHPSLFVDPDVYLAAITGVHDLAQVFSLAKPASTPAPPKPPQLPDVNTILRILGPWLFDASLNRTAAPRFALCRAEAIRCLGGLLCRHGIGRTKQVSWPFTIRALMAIQKALLDTDEVVVVAAAVVSCSRIFGTHGTHTLRGVGVLAGSFHYAIDHILSLTVTKTAVAPSRKDSLVDKRSSMASDLDSSAAVPAAVGGVAVTVLRRACIEACSSLLTIHSHYPLAITKQVEKTLVANERLDESLLPGIYSSLPRYQSSNVVTLLINYLKTEQDPTNQQMAMWQLTIAVQKEALFWAVGLASTRNSQVPATISTICSFVTKVPSRWKPAVIFTALECLRYLTIVSEHLFKHVFSSCVFLISCVCEFMAANAQVLRATRSPPPYLDQLIASATSCLLEWVVTTPQLLSKAQVMVKVIATTVDAADVHVDFPATTPHADHATRQSAQHLLEYLVKHHAHGNVDGAKQTYDPAAVHYTWNLHTVLSILETTDYVQLTLRDSSGCYQWRTQPQYVPSKLATLASAPPSPPPAQSHPSQHAPTPTSTPVSPLEANPDPLLRSLRKNAASLTSWSTEGWEGNSGGKHATDASAKRHEAQVTLFQSLLQSQSNDFVQHRRIATVNLLEPPPPAHSTTHIARRLLSQLGFLSVASWGSLLPLLPSSGQLVKDLQALDRLPTRETYEIGIAYVVNQPSRAGYDVVNLVTTSTCSDAYLGFLATMGSAVDAHSYGGFLGYLDRNLPDSRALVYAQHNYEVAYYVPTLGHASVLDKAEVLIVWNECQQNYRPGTALWASAYNLPPPKACVTIVIDPLDDGLFCVRICVDGSAFDLSNGDATRAADDTFSGRVLGPLQVGDLDDGHVRS